MLDTRVTGDREGERKIFNRILAATIIMMTSCVVIVIVRSIIGRIRAESRTSSRSPVCKRRQIITVHSDGDGVCVEIKMIRIFLSSNLPS